MLDFAVYLALFPHLVAGPIVRARELLPQLQEQPDPRRIDASLAFRLIFAGLFKKVVISSFVSSAIVEQVFANPGQHTNFEILFGIYAYAVQIYADFSGYTDIAIGCALLLGLRFPQNFDAPYTATSMQSFWRRWHMTLSFWLRDYVYIPLGGNHGESPDGRAEPVPHHGDRWPVARGGLDVRGVGSDPGGGARRGTALERPAGSERDHAGPAVAGPAMVRDVPRRLPGVGVLPGGVLRPGR